MTPSVSVVVSTFNRSALLRDCLAALAGQDHPSYEVVVVDDGSGAEHADANAAIAAASGVRLLRQENRGPASARNRGVEAARGDYVAFTDDDCEPAPTWLRRLTTGATVTNARGGRTVNGLADDVYADATQLLIDYLYEYYRARDGRFFTSNNLLMPRRPLLELGGFDETMRHAGGEDRELCGRWLARGWGLDFVEDAVVHHGHALTLARFWRQHFTYGRGAWTYRLRRRRWTTRPVRLEPFAFYRDLLLYPRARARGWQSSALLLLAQVANASGYFYARARDAEASAPE